MSELLELERAIGERDVARVVALARRFDEGAEPAIDDPAREKLLFDLADWLWSAGEPKAALEVMALALDLASRNGALDPVATARRLDRLADRLEATGQLTLAADVWKRAITLTETVEAGAAPVWRLQRYVRVLRGIGAPTSQIEEAEHALARLQHREPGAEPMMPPASPIIAAPARPVPQPLPQPVPQSAPPPASPGAFRRAGPAPLASPQSRPPVSPPASPIPDFGMAREEGRKPSGLRQRLDRKRAESDAFQAPELEAVFDDVAAPAALVDEAQAYHRVPVHFMTHRGLGDRANPYATFSDAPPPTQVLHFGIAHVTVPLKRDVGALPVQGWLASRLFDPDPAVYLTIRSIDLLSHGVFFDTLRTRIAYSRRKEALVFVHGFNTTFTEALFRVAQLAVDLEIDGAPILYSWPSRGSVFGYVADREQSRNVELHRDFERFLMEISERTGATHIHLVGHSMGAQMLLSTLDRLHDTLPKPPVRRFDEIVFAAPDVARDQFTAAVRRVAPLGRRTTVYASRSDIPLTLSGILAGGGRSGDRTGVDAAALAGLREVECIDTTLAPDDFLAHGAFASRAIDDLQGVLWLSLDPTRRKRLIRRQAPDGVYWIYDPMKDTNAFTRAIAFVRRHGVAGALDHVARLIDARRRQAAPESEMALHLAVQSELDQLRSVLT